MFKSSDPETVAKILTQKIIVQKWQTFLSQKLLSLHFIYFANF